MKNILLGMTTAELRKLARDLGEKEFRGKQIADWIYHHGVKEIAEMVNLPAILREKLTENYMVGRSSVLSMSKSKDHTFKLLLGLVDGEKVETVGMLYKDRFSCCVSTQAGCPIGCIFCATGAGGYKRNLTAGEVIDQVLAVQEAAPKDGLTEGNGRVSHVVFMGMGEPLLNYEATLKAVSLINSEMGIGMRNITVSTIGYVPGIYRLAEEHLQLTLAVSLHAGDEMLRKKLVPGMTRYSIREIIKACRDYIKATGRRVTFEYCLLKNLNDGREDAAGLAALLRGLNCHVNLIPYNDFPGNIYERPGKAAVDEFRQVLEEAGINVTQRAQKGAGIQAACGQLRRQHNSR
ncbi:MAG: 23S rRNA (adenine(2503)-C(2))-methyltransferase RlmN [Chloroflexi bacterium]|nr:23S rRNA (adenine(2503)-C(2))-methyltransferase RlmN [Chloroflexota bacterium]